MLYIFLDCKSSIIYEFFSHICIGNDQWLICSFIIDFFIELFHEHIFIFL